MITYYRKTSDMSNVLIAHCFESLPPQSCDDRKHPMQRQLSRPPIYEYHAIYPNTGLEMFYIELDPIYTFVQTQENAFFPIDIQGCPAPYYDGACNSFRIPSYIPNIMVALGIVFKRWGVSPPYMATMPPSFHTSLKHCTRPVYLSCPFS